MKRATQALVAVGLLVLLASRRSKASSGKNINPSTGRPIVSPGTRHLSAVEVSELVTRAGIAQPDKALAFAQRESGLFADVVVDTRGMSPLELRAYWGKKAAPELSVGLWQINLLANAHFVPGDTLDAKIATLKDPEKAVLVVKKMSNGGTNWAPWGG